MERSQHTHNQAPQSDIPEDFWTPAERSYVYTRLNGLAAFYEHIVAQQNLENKSASPVTEREEESVPVRVATPRPHKSKQVMSLKENGAQLASASLAFMPQQTLSETFDLKYSPGQGSKKKSRKKLAHVFIALAVVINLVGLGFVVRATLKNKVILQDVTAHADRVQTEPRSLPVDVPEEAPPTESDYVSHVVAADEPRYLQIPSLGVKARVLSLGLTATGAFDAPKNIFDTGWYTASSKPGVGAGAVLIDGHSTGLTKEGVFTRLGTLVAGQKIVITRGDGSVISYSVVKVQKLPKDQVDMSSLLLSQNPKKQGLNLITCSGSFNQRDFSFSERTLVYAVVD